MTINALYRRKVACDHIVAMQGEESIPGWRAPTPLGRMSIVFSLNRSMFDPDQLIN